MKKFIVSPSILACKKENLIPSIEKIDGYAEFLHFDVMDGKFVPPTTFDEKLLKVISGHHHMVNDVHLMVVNPDSLIDGYVEAGAHYITVHYEAFDDTKKLIECINHIKNANVKAGISIKPNTNVEVLYPLMGSIDLVLVMSVEPGYGGQSFMMSAIDKIVALRNYIDSRNLNVLIEVDGGINDKTVKYVKDAGVDAIVAGTYLFEHEDILERIKLLKQ